MMLKQSFTVTLLEDVIISQRATTLGGHSTLDYLPGATLLGACAARLYAQLSESDAYTVFHSGQVRFGNAFPLSETHRLCYPMPICWYEPKSSESAIKNGQLRPENLQNYRFKKSGSAEPIQAKPLDNGYIALDGYIAQPAPQLRMKTTINSQTGRTNENQFFGYTSLSQGLRFGFVLEADEAVSATLFTQIVETFNQKLQLGRSRSAEYGNVSVEPADWREDDKTQPKLEKTSEITLWLLADMALQDEWGQPTLIPTPQHFGLPEGQLNLEKTFLHSRYYVPFNSHYRRREWERTVLNQGSVLHLTLTEPIDIDSVIKKLESGVGLYRQVGLGQVWVNPPLLATPQPRLESAPVVTMTTAPQPPDAPLAKWLLAQVEQTNQAQLIEETAKQWIITLKLLYRSAQLLATVPVGGWVGPSVTQWGRVLELAKTPNVTATTIRTRLLTDERAICKTHDPDWTAQVLLEEQKELHNFRQWLQQQVEATSDDVLPALLAQVAWRAINIARTQDFSD